MIKPNVYIPISNLRVGDVEDPDFIASLPGPFDIILLVDTIGALEDCQGTIELLHRQCTRETRLIVTYYSHLWEPLVLFAELIGWRSKQPLQNTLSPADIRSLAELADFEFIKSEMRLLSPLRLFGLGRLINRFISILPIIRALQSAALFGLPLFATGCRRSSLRFSCDPCAQRAWKHRAGNQANATILR